MSRSAHLGLRLTPAMKAALAKQAKKSEQSLSSLVVDICANWLRAKTKGTEK